MENTELSIFSKILEEDLDEIIEQQSIIDDKLNLDKGIDRCRDYAFNYWILNKIFGIDIEVAVDNITDFKDYGIDCWSYSEDDKILFLIQNKRYSKGTSLARENITDFISAPITKLLTGKYPKSKQLQDIFNQIKDDSEATIKLYFYITNNDNKKVLDEFGRIATKNEISAKLEFDYFDLNKLADIFYQSSGNKVAKNQNFKIHCDKQIIKFKDINSNKNGYFISLPILELYNIMKKAKELEYDIYAKNVRNFLTYKSSINKGIKNTLLSKEERENFVYYNNGITILCASVIDDHENSKNVLKVVDPQIINGCQTSMTIFKVIEETNHKIRQESFKKVNILAKVIGFKEANKEDTQFIHNIVEFSNKQNSLKTEAFISLNAEFQRLKNEFSEYGFYLAVKPGERQIFAEYVDSTKSLYLGKARSFNKKYSNIDNDLINEKNIIIDLNKILQIFIAFMFDSQIAYTKRPTYLNPNNETYFKKYCLYILRYLKTSQILDLYLIYLQSEKIVKKLKSDKESKGISRSLFVIDIIGYYFKNSGISLTEPNSILLNWEHIESFFEKPNKKELVEILTKVIQRYTAKRMKLSEIGPNELIKSKIEYDEILDIIDASLDYGSDFKEKIESYFTVSVKI